MSVGLGSRSNEFDSPCFATTLSEGDKNSLALAFFLTRLEKDENLSQKVIVIDDPISSLDLNRQTYTRRQILKLCRKSKQVIALSHDPFFLKSLKDSGENFPCKALKIHGVSFCSSISEWDIALDTKDNYEKDRCRLKEYLNGDSQGAMTIARSIRPVLERFYKFNYPDDFLPNEWLGDFIGKIENADAGRLAQLKPYLEDLRDIKEYAKPFMHGQFSQQDSLLDQELRAYVQKTLDLIQSI